MSGFQERRVREAAEAAVTANEALVFAAASIVKEMSKPMPVTAEVPVREVVAEGRRYRLEGRRLQTGTGSGPLVLVFVEPRAEPEEENAWRHAFRLTIKEARVAVLLAEGCTNEEVAAELSISPHTARHHTERVLAKLGVTSRREVRRVLAL